MASKDSNSFSDLDLSKWKSYEDILMGSLWLLGPRDKSGPHQGDYWGNFVPQIPQQILQRFTKRGEVVVDLFSGMGTTLIECRRLGRHGIGVELNPDVARQSEARIEQAENPLDITTTVLVADATTEEARDMVRAQLGRLAKSRERAGEGTDQGHCDCVIMHPPYHNVIKFSDNPADLCNSDDIDHFLLRFERAVINAHELVRGGRFMALVIGDIYAKSEWVPLGFECMEVCRRAGFRLKAINVKDIQGNERGKGKSENLWKYRALKQGFYIFKHEYVMVFQKR